ncbi:MAG: hypothetical protein AAF756_02255 [Pseudomonadota bacterium]
MKFYAAGQRITQKELTQLANARGRLLMTLFHELAEMADLAERKNYEALAAKAMATVNEVERKLQETGGEITRLQ